MNTNIVTKVLRSNMHRVIMVALVLVLLFSVMPARKVSAAGEIFMPTTVSCRIGSFQVRENIYGSYQGQWATIRHHLWIKYPGQTYWTYTVTPWSSRQLFGTPLNTVGGWVTFNNIPRNSLVQMKTEVVYSYANGTRSPVYSQLANHIDYLYETIGTFCRVY